METPTLRVPLYDVERQSQAKPTHVAVTGVTGYMAGPIVQRLLAMGHTVHGTCRNPDNLKSISHLTSLPGASDRLKLFKADLLVIGSFDEAMLGCTIAIHTACPYSLLFRGRNARSKLIDPAIQGTENVLGSVERTPSITRVVFTSSIAAVTPTAGPTQTGKLTEANWNNVASEKVLPYHYAKTSSEQRAWQIANAQSRWSLVVINPPCIYGPPLGSRADGESVNMIKRLSNGEGMPLCPMIGIPFSDVRDIAAAHTVAALAPNAQGRYLAVAGNTNLRELNNILATTYPRTVPRAGIRPPKWLVITVGLLFGITPDIARYTVDVHPVFDSSKLMNEFGFKFISKWETFIDQANAMNELGIIKIKELNKK